MIIYKPTWLYIKQHNKTGLKYFGKTVRKDPVKYKGSGVRWTAHLAKHGDDVDTIWYKLFEDKESLVEYATRFSLENNIVNSPDWANLKIEDGLMGGRNEKHSAETKQKMSLKRKEQIITEETKEKIRQSRLGREPWNKGKQGIKYPPLSQEKKDHLSKIKKGIPKEKYRCPHCQREIAGASNAKRWHFDNCSLFFIFVK